MAQIQQLNKNKWFWGSVLIFTTSITLLQFFVESELVKSHQKQLARIASLNITIFNQIYVKELEPAYHETQQVFYQGRNPDLQVSVLNEDAELIVHSPVHWSEMASLVDQSSMQEVKLLQSEQSAYLHRIDQQSNTPYIYYAQKFKSPDNKNYIIRIGVPKNIFRTVLNNFRMQIAVFIIVFISFYWLSHKLERKNILKLASEHNVELKRKIAQTANNYIELQNASSCLAVAKTTDEAVNISQQLLKSIFDDIYSTIELSDNIYKSNSISCWAIRTGHSYTASDPQSYCQHAVAPLQQYQCTHHLCYPLLAEGRTFGVLTILFAEDKSIMVKQEHEIQFEFIAQNLALNLARIELKDKLNKKANTDSLTGLWNRRYFFSHINQWRQNKANLKKSAAVLMLDVDFFKQVNDTLGHDAGDEALRIIAEALMTNSRSDKDVVARIGGEEFAIFCENIEVEQATLMFSRISKYLKENPLRGQRFITVSMGVAFYPNFTLEGDELVRHADKALYVAKERGRDQICFAPSTKSVRDVKATSTRKT
ncbi:membrane associated GGDEF protein [Catenovulum agarivorans DS-2]|uniref:diguanylate cyclase n=1 Tax=Catenovulum agarivorans DS-2 TaxID=1328313 RepID=W7QU90_9ALTE|nr:diguanylate cyclase [Catenovulum agarivorans]EWH11408.1 membrane associated GGDEF protein [Catenovulum agarivorans DS-2]